jgi:CubicO group peptidase (beta-lactamase class C family)
MKISILLLLLLAFTTHANCQVSNNSRALGIDSLLTNCYTNGLFNGVALVADSGKIILQKGYGLSNRETNAPLSINDRFYIGSLTKQFTAVLILQLQEDELIDINTPISAYLPEFKALPYSNITVHHLLTHTSGLGNYTAHTNFDKSIPYTDQDMFTLIKHPLLFEPGTDWSYSNSGYFLLGKIAERVTHKDYGTLLNETIFEPLKMNHSSFSLKWCNTHVAKGYRRTINGIKPMPTYALVSLFSTGGIYSTAHDLFIWAQALDGNTLLTEKSKEILFQPMQNDYACGLYVKKGTDEFGTKYERHFHGGMLQGYHSFMLKRIPQKQVVILLDNYYNQEIQTIKNRIWSALVDENIRTIKPKLSNILYTACAQNTLIALLDSISTTTAQFESQFELEEFDINTVGYRLMEAKRYTEATALFNFNLTRYPNSWNVYDSMGELLLKQGKYKAAEEHYKKSLLLHPENKSAEMALQKIKLLTSD